AHGEAEAEGARGRLGRAEAPARVAREGGLGARGRRRVVFLFLFFESVFGQSPVLRGIFGRAGGDGAPPSAGGDQDREQGQSPRRGGSETHGPSDTTRPRAIHTVLGAPPVPFADPIWYARDRGAAAEEHGAVRHPGHR